MIVRTVEEHVRRLAGSFPVVTITGPRQSGKTTLCRNVFSTLPYVTLEDPDARAVATHDPRGFLSRYGNGAVLDEVQRAPGLLSYIQGIVDRENREGMFVLTGSAQFELLHTLSQSLAGRTALVTLLPLSLHELQTTSFASQSLAECLYRGGYPRIYDKSLSPTEALRFYFATYVERDVRSLVNVRDLAVFETFLRLCAARSGQILNMNSLASDCGINHTTVRAWLSVLEASYILHLVRPHHSNLGKRLIKSPKLYFWDVGLMACLLGIEHADQTMTHPLRGAMFETMVVSELLKARHNSLRSSNLYFFADSQQHEVDAILEFPEGVVPVEVKSAQTLAQGLFKSLSYYQGLNPASGQPALIYGGEESVTWGGHRVIPFRQAAAANQWAPQQPSE